ncbi:bifunctional methyltransferase/pyrophosphohydrolase YabN [Priestia endophytica]|jgi:tetrapyrrole methylase family protein / MazG family protein|uniref:Tetrapyrrole methylase family protein / MazG family protein n=1 Tax=Priestia endophytica DSM 13796 TaxID=1121089 RepID=A0A1I6C1E3_9BACI|nr:nucleoside triphosphate pyrophosphohydrolase [Priestia endophytica]KYG32828.1 MazG family protein [Priestia endophytica]MBG9812205.1 hypothetical protein [Priestia endophytica]SFQ87012.1 tetrapyrrole methylase family protein / MazG family protein [Priestia endophytica DSM 13796]
MAKKITVLGLGAGDYDQLTIGTLKILQGTKEGYIRTKHHPLVSQLEAEGITFQSFDDSYEAFKTFEEVYEHISNVLIEKAAKEDVLYVVPGHPMVAEQTVQLLLQKGKEKEVEIEISGGQSFLDPLFTAVEIDPIEGFQLLDGTSLKKDEIQVTQHVIIAQVYDGFVASDVKLVLMEKLPNEYPVYIVRSAGSQNENVQKVQLYELDHHIREVDNLLTLYIPPVKDEEVLYKQFPTLRSIIATLRGPDGCPWDQKQTHESLRSYVLEEAYELIEAIDNGDDDHIVEELGDILLQVMLHAQIGEDEGMFTVDDVIEGISAKMVRRHPHVFGKKEANNVEDVLTNWEEIKKQEKQDRESILDGIPLSMPSLLKAYHIQKKVSKVGFDWDDVAPMYDKVQEELEEFKQEVKKSTEVTEEMMEEFGDILTAIVNVARYYKIDPEVALAKSNAKFINRFNYIEERVKERGADFRDFSLEQLDEFWNEAKKKGL